MTTKHLHLKMAPRSILLFLILCVVEMTKMYAENITFVDTNVKALCVANWDTNGDGELSYAEAAVVTDLGEVFRNKSSITSFDELQYFINLASIGSYAFQNCDGLTSVEIPNSVTSIGGYAFYGCSGLISITSFAEAPPTLGNYAFYYVNKSIPVYVPCGSLETYQIAEGWNEFSNFQEYIPELTVVSSDENMGTVTVLQEPDCETDAIVQATPIGDNVFFNWTENGEIVSTEATYSFTVTSDRNLVANFTNARNQFWLSFMQNGFRNHTEGYWVTTQVLISAKRDCSGTVSNPLTGWSRTFTVSANDITTVNIPEVQGYHGETEYETVTQKAIKVVSTDTISVYCTNIAHVSFDASFVLPIESLGNEYIIQSYDQSTAGSLNNYVTDNETSAFVIVATEDNTQVSITPTVTTLGGHAAGETYSISLNEGETYHVRSTRNGSQRDLSGTHIVASDCKRIAVFNGNTLTCIPINMGNGYDHIVEQAMPLRSWGKNFVVTNSLNRNRDFIKITSSANNNVITMNGDPLTTLQAYESYIFSMLESEHSCFISASQPSAVYLYNNSSYDQNPLGGLGDPSMVWIAPVEQRINDITFSTFDNSSINITDHCVNIIVSTSDVNNVYLDNALIPSSDFSPVNGNSQYSFARETISHGVHHLHCSGGLNAHVYGFGHAKGYAYNIVANNVELEENFVVSASVLPLGSGVITGSGYYAPNETCVLTATQNEGLVFFNWTENGEIVSTEATYSFTVTGDRTLTANFGTLTNHWTTSNFKNYKPVKGIILIDGVEQFSNMLEIGAFCGDECRASSLATLFPITQQYVVNLSIGSDLDSPNEQITFRIYDHALQQELDIQSLNDMTLTDFNPIGTLNNWYPFAFSHEVTLSVSVTPEGAGTVTGAGSYLPDTEVTLEATANAGYAFKRWSQNGQTVSEANPYVFTLTGNMELTAEFDHQQQNALSAGWSWWSTYIDVDGADGLAMLENSLGHNGVMVMGQGQNTENYYSQVGYDFWWGDLTELHAEKGYKILASAPCDAVMTGPCADPENHPITISQNWNWIGYPCQTQQPVASATFQPSNEDIIMGQGPTSTYYEGYGWWPDFDMEPGKAYLYYSTSSTTKQMVFHESRESNQDATEPTRDNHWTARNFKNYKPVKGIILIDGVEQFSSTLEIGAFCGDECRASSLATLFPITQQYVVNLSIGSDLDSPNEQITFRIFDHAQQQELGLQSLNDMTLTDFNPIGSMNNWYQFGFATPEVTFTLPITGYGTSTGGYYLIAPPIDDINPDDIEGMTDGDFDLYYFDQAQDLEWVNYKAEPFNLESGKGYLYAHKTDVTLTFTGAPYSGNGQVPLAYTAGNPLAGWNLVGNPFGQTAYLADGRDFYVMKDDGSEIIPAITNGIQPMQGVFVVAANADDNTVTFTTDMPAGDGRALAIEIGKDRSISPIDRAIVRFGEGRTLPKFMLNEGNTKVYLPQGDTKYAVVRSDSEGQLPVNFKAAENGTYTFSVNADNLELDYLHLIDHITGADIDLLQQPSYTFQATGNEYEARFMLVFKVETGIGENMQETFCYAKDGVLYINTKIENPTLQIVDAMGRVIHSGDAMNRVSTGGMAPGVYVLRLINGENVKTQKIIIQ